METRFLEGSVLLCATFTLNKHDEFVICVSYHPLKIYSVVELSCHCVKTWPAPWLFHLLVWNRLAYNQSHKHWLNSEMKTIQCKLLIKLQSSFRGQTSPPLLPAGASGWWATYLLDDGFGHFIALLSFLLSLLIASSGLPEDGAGWRKRLSCMVRVTMLPYPSPAPLMGPRITAQLKTFWPKIHFSFQTLSPFCLSDPREDELPLFSSLLFCSGI